MEICVDETFRDLGRTILIWLGKQAITGINVRAHRHVRTSGQPETGLKRQQHEEKEAVRVK